ncbi:sigma-54 dependent transcriptional regulator [Algoriphagus sp. A40]|uniref:sigma-54-dependent transcriptional regulator n=1 Tax=Algoriphagus sp. A40 TaxID=1945863 RepID=UPI00098481AA|nr:sigma-54 dependent transcriptional regulator [Algoriphagus sp. A40]OOG76851.1 DNA-binding response regulator [Algoriphagus sp. A40]
MKEKILIVEDQFVEANNLQEMLETKGYEVIGIARSVPIALSLIEKEVPDLVLLDIYLKGPLTGIDLAKTLRKQNIPFIYLSANSNKDTLEAAKATCPYGFLVKPFREKDVLVTLEIARYLHSNSLEAMRRRGEMSDTHEQQLDHRYLGKKREQSDSEVIAFQGIVGRSQLLKNVLSQLAIVAPTDTSVLILGESGTGKERIGACIHELSSRKGKPYIRVNCAALPTALVESELFGHERGAFTGASERRIGKFELAQNGTILLDEISEMPIDVQVKFLRVLQEREIERIGGNATIKINVRIIAATNRNLEYEVAMGKFRMDLYYRLNVFPLTLPALRERKEDIPVLARHFVDLYAKKLGRGHMTVAESAIGPLLDYSWPGNIRELEHLMERTVLMNSGAVINSIPLPESSKPEIQKNEESIQTIDEMERAHIITALKHCRGKVSGVDGAANLLGINVSTLNSKMKKLGIDTGKTFFVKSK